MSTTRKEAKIMNKAAFADLRSYLLEKLLTDNKIGIAPTIEAKQSPQPLKVKCLRCGFLFEGSPENRICKTCRAYNREIS